jgi:hypothetical protein
MTYAKEEINQILSLKGWNQSTIDVFNLYGVLTIGVSSMNPEANGKPNSVHGAKASYP